MSVRSLTVWCWFIWCSTAVRLAPLLLCLCCAASPRCVSLPCFDVSAVSVISPSLFPFSRFMVSPRKKYSFRSVTPHAVHNLGNLLFVVPILQPGFVWICPQRNCSRSTRVDWWVLCPANPEVMHLFIYVLTESPSETNVCQWCWRDLIPFETSWTCSKPQSWEVLVCPPSTNHIPIVRNMNDMILLQQKMCISNKYYSPARSLVCRAQNLSISPCKW